AAAEAIRRAAAAEHRIAELEDGLLVAAAACRESRQQADQAEVALRAIEQSRCWRATAWPRRMAGRLRRRG
ncbi:MAG: hypothetical protein ACREFY_10370, partial [Acetobacteraceae bacterium]